MYKMKIRYCLWFQGTVHVLYGFLHLSQSKEGIHHHLQLLYQYKSHLNLIPLLHVLHWHQHVWSEGNINCGERNIQCGGNDYVEFSSGDNCHGIMNSCMFIDLNSSISCCGDIGLRDIACGEFCLGNRSGVVKDLLRSWKGYSYLRVCLNTLDRARDIISPMHLLLLNQ